ncbi:hypothetical protein HUT18_30310 [Streptomyces sp. NA04227]|uniref:hypothetical protein n=1 Tax=Streptomyces sp. NA04227 TaxID=2742136 RepID=UPI00158FE3EC|nr:hypothetical protein [Streptomyces sp. NA04227]QKW10075.1 hypothetical protein HUT18_30310 [Streptomyces sp. NA04227]
MALPEDFLNSIALDGSPGQAFASHRLRAINNAKNLAWRKPLEGIRGAEAGENETIYLLAHMHAATDDPDFAAPDQRPSKVLAPEILRTLRLKEDGLVGTSKDYDMTLKGLMTIVYRYRSLLTDDDFNWVMDNLILAAHDQGSGRTITGAHTVDIEYLDDFVVIYPETENHLLMIESSRYLINQLKHQTAGDVYDNKSNGLHKWLLKTLQVIAEHDFLEFSARPYARHSIHALLNLYEFADDIDIRTGAQVILDYVMVKCAISSSRCRRVAPFRRHQEQINHQNNEYNDIFAQRGDQISGYFMACTGNTGPDGKPVLFHAGFIDQFTAVIGGTSSYRPPPAAYIWAMGVGNPPSLQRFQHGKRPQLVAAGEDADGGLEIYYKSPSFLMSAGGMFLNSGYGRDEVDLFKDAWEQTSRAQATTLIPTGADLKFHDLVRFQPHPDPAVDPYADDPEDPDRHHTTAVNNGVHVRIMAGTNLRPAGYKAITEHETFANPVLAVNGDRLHMAWARKGYPPGLINIAKVQYTDVLDIDGVEGVEDLRSPAASAVSPALTALNGRVYLAWRDSDNQINIYFSDDGGNTYRATPRLADSTYLNPCLATHAGKLYLAWVGRGNDKINVARLALVGNTAGAYRIEVEVKTVLGATSDAAPALASHNGRLFLGWRGSGNESLNLAFSQDEGVTFTGTKTFTDESEHSPSLVSHGGRLFMSWAGVGNDDVNVAKVVLFGNTAGGFGIEGLADKKVLPHETDAAPALASLNGLLFLAWKDIDDDFLHIQLSGDGTFDVAGPWFFSDLNTPPRKFGFYLAAYRVIAPLSGCTLGFVYAREADEQGAPPMSFQTFKDTVLARNQHLSQQFGSVGDVYEFNAPDFDRTYSIRFQPTGDKYRARITTPTDLHTDLGQLPLASGQAMNSPGAGHDGLIHIRQPACDTETILDFRDREKPNIKDNTKACPQPWLDRADALRTLASSLEQSGDTKHATVALTDRIAVYQKLIDADPGNKNYRASLAQAIFDLLYARHRRLPSDQALRLAERGAREFEVLAGLRTAGSSTPVDYEQLAGFTPNEYWDWHDLTGALYNLEVVAWDAGDRAAAAAWAVKRIRVYERLTQVDAVKYRPFLASALWELIYYRRTGLDATAALSFAQQGLRAYEILAGLRQPSTTTPVDYAELAGSMPNEYWDWHDLTGALYNLEVVAWEAGDRAAAAGWAVKRIRVYERLTQVDAVKYRPFLASALWELIYYRRTGLDAAAASTFAQEGLRVYETLAGLRQPGTATPVDYEQLATFTPNEYWDWHDLTGALYNLEVVAWEAEDRAAAAAWAVKRIQVYERLTQVDAVKYRPFLASALWELIYYRRTGLDAAAASTFAQEGLRVYETLAGLRQPDTTAPVDYEQLGTFTPNEYWDWHDLTGALYNLEVVAWEAGDRAAAAAWAIKRIQVYERLTQVDAVKYRPFHASALWELIYYRRTGLDAAAALNFAQEGLRVHETLAELREPGTTTPVNYEQLADFTPNQYWDWHDLTGALYNLEAVAWEAGDRTAASAWAIKRIQVYERLVEVDAVKYRPFHASALWELIYYRRTGLDTAAASRFAQEGLRAHETLAGLREPGTTTPVNYEQLTDFTPNEYWDWHDLTGALYNLEAVAWEAGDRTAAAAWAIKRIQVYERLTQADPVKYRPFHASALWELIYYRRTGLDAAAASTFAQKGLRAYETLAGLRQPGTTAPVDYEKLADFTPNEYWDWHDLTGALYNLEAIAWEAGDRTAAAAWTVKRIQVYERLTQADSAKYRPFLASALWELIYYRQTGLDAAVALNFAQKGLRVYETLAGLRQPGTTSPVDYEQLADFTPNEYWDWHELTGALYNLAHLHKAADGDSTAGQAEMRSRVRVAERLVEVDPAKWTTELDQARSQAAAFGI